MCMVQIIGPHHHLQFIYIKCMGAYTGNNFFNVILCRFYFERSQNLRKIRGEELGIIRGTIKKAEKEKSGLNYRCIMVELNLKITGLMLKTVLKKIMLVVHF